MTMAERAQAGTDETVLVTGANGFVGINLVHQLGKKGIPVLATSRRPPDAAAELAPAAPVEWVLCDVTQRQALIELVQSRAVTRIIHAAAVTPTPEVEQQDPTRIVDVNLGGTVNALEAARLGQVRRFLFVSSTVLYRGFPPDQGRAREADALPPANLYGICKEACERLCRQYRDLYGLSALGMRLGTAYGPREKPSLSRSRLSAVAQLLAWARECPAQPLRVHGAHIRRDYIYVEDACAAMAEMVLHPQPRGGIYNLSSDVAYPLADALRALQAAVPGFQWQQTTDPAAADIRLAAADARAPLDLSRLRADLPHLHFRDLDTGIADYVAWVQAVHG